ncbi:tegument protein [Psittacid alphaherpesvirus 5]|uniref:Tegument protein n=1 Tax=Psittacid alphaherpesvirus 5 TaxID=2972693 RepID=A0A5P9JQ56_9ALPH|nr:tegument protein [Psittacid alphaherpesvirus 5]QFU14553.1 tegument protein [Psittacid alphaherpesvirus 5]UOO01024.1 tegument protein [Psittacid alphaherpesvirus 5]
MDVSRVTDALTLVRLFIPNCVTISDVLTTREELSRLGHARNVSRVLARAAAAIQTARSMKCPHGTEKVLHQTLADNIAIFRTMYAVLAYIYLSPTVETDGVLDSVVAQTTDRMLTMNDISVLMHAMKTRAVNLDHNVAQVDKLIENKENPMEFIPLTDNSTILPTPPDIPVPICANPKRAKSVALALPQV